MEAIGDVDISIHRCFYTCVTKELLQHLRLHTAFDRAGCISMSKRVHTKAFDASFVAELI